MTATWDKPDFSDPRFAVERVDPLDATCRHPGGCDVRADYLVEYTMRRGGWTYEYGTYYCEQHLPAQARANATDC